MHVCAGLSFWTSPFLLYSCLAQVSPMAILKLCIGHARSRGRRLRFLTRKVSQANYRRVSRIVIRRVVKGGFNARVIWRGARLSISPVLPVLDDDVDASPPPSLPSMSCDDWRIDEWLEWETEHLRSIAGNSPPRADPYRWLRHR